MGTFYTVTKPNTSYTVDNGIFDVMSGASLNLTGSSGTVVMESGSTGVTLSGKGDSVLGANADGVSLSMSGSGHTVTLGNNAHVIDNGSNDTITVGANGYCFAFGDGVTINATAGGTALVVQGRSTINANNDMISLTQSSAQLTGSGNQVHMNSGIALNLDGSNNAIALDGLDSIKTKTSSVTEQADNTIVLTGTIDPSSIHLTGGVATVQLGNGNVATLSNVVTNSTLQYVDSTGAVTTTALMDSNVDWMPMSYKVHGTAFLNLKEADIVELKQNANVTITGTRAQIVNYEGPASATIYGSGLSLSSNVEGFQLQNYGSNSDALLSANSTLGDFGNSNSYHVKAGCSVTSSGTGSIIYVDGAGCDVTVSGSNSQFQLSSMVGAEQIHAQSGYFVQESANGKISYSASSFSISDGVALIGIGNGNVVRITDVTANTSFSGNVVNQLVGAMATYGAGASGSASTPVVQTQAESTLFASSHQ